MVVALLENLEKSGNLSVLEKSGNWATKPGKMTICVPKSRLF